MPDDVSLKGIRTLAETKKGWSAVNGWPDDSIGGSYRSEPSSAGRLNYNISTFWYEFNQLKTLLNNMYRIRNDTTGAYCSVVERSECTGHSGSSYTGNQDLKSYNSAANAMKACSCHARQQTVCNCQSRTSTPACDCNVRGNCTCNLVLTCGCNTRSSHICACRYNACSPNLCTCNGVWVCENEGSPQYACSCHNRALFCPCQSRTYASTCSCEGRCTCDLVKEFS